MRQHSSLCFLPAGQQWVKAQLRSRSHVHRDFVANIKRSPTQNLYSPKQTELSEIPACSELTNLTVSVLHSMAMAAGHPPEERTLPKFCMSNSSGCTGTAGEEGKVSESLL